MVTKKQKRKQEKIKRLVERKMWLLEDFDFSMRNPKHPESAVMTPERKQLYKKLLMQASTLGLRF